MLKKVVGLYMRVSHHDETKKIIEESNSITNQRLQLIDYAKKYFPDNERIEFIDDGYSGTSFNRPAMNELLDKIKKGKIHIVIVKDLSRFGRNYIEVGIYLEQIFPALGIRFISINDKFDSGKEGSKALNINMQFKNVIHDYYSKELSRKLQIAKKQQIEKGKFLAAKPPYGYWKSIEEKGKLVIDPISSEIVKEIFERYKQGNSIYKITKELNAKNIPCPNKRLVNANMLHKKNSAYLVWTAHAVKAILTNETYIGNTIGNKYYKPSIQEKGCKKRKKTEWIITKNTHEAIIESNLFYEVQALFNKKQSCKNIPLEKTTRKKEEYLFKGRLVCYKCGSILTMMGKHKENIYYGCTKCRAMKELNYITKNQLCSVLKVIFEKKSQLLKDSQISHTFDYAETQKIIEKIEKEIENKKKRLPELYRNFALKIFTEKDYVSFRNIIQEEIQQLEKKQIELEKQIKEETKEQAKEEIEEQVKEQIKEEIEEETKEQTKEQTEKKKEKKIHQIISIYKDYEEELTNEILKKEIEKIIIYHKKKIDIIWKLE